MNGKLLLALALVPATFAQPRSFVACPIVRDTKTVPCFLAEYEGETYYLTIQQDIQAELYPPQLLHEVLVEGTVAPGPRICGGIPLKPVKLSVLPELNLSCNTILPAEPGIEAPPTRRPAGPSTRQAPVIVGGAAPAGGPPRERFTAPFAEREFNSSLRLRQFLFVLPRYSHRQSGGGVRHRRQAQVRGDHRAPRSVPALERTHPH